MAARIEPAYPSILLRQKGLLAGKFLFPTSFFSEIRSTQQVQLPIQSYLLTDKVGNKMVYRPWLYDVFWWQARGWICRSQTIFFLAKYQIERIILKKNAIQYVA